MEAKTLKDKKQMHASDLTTYSTTVLCQTAERRIHFWRFMALYGDKDMTPFLISFFYF